MSFRFNFEIRILKIFFILILDPVEKPEFLKKKFAKERV